MLSNERERNPDRRGVGKGTGRSRERGNCNQDILYEKKSIFNKRRDETQVTYKRKIITSRVDLVISIIEAKNQCINFIITC